MNKNLSKSIKIYVTFLLVTFIFIINTNHAFASTKTWTGTTSVAWSTSTNWSGGVAPVAGDDLVFPTSASNKAMTNTLALSFNSIDFSGSGYSVTGTAITLGTPTITSSCGAVTSICDSSASGGNSISLAITMTAVKAVQVSNSAEKLTLQTGVISGTGGGFNKTGSGTLKLSGANTFTGTVGVTAGTLQIGASSTVATASPTGTTGIITVSSGATLDMAGFSYSTSHTQAFSINGTGISSGGAIMNSSATTATIIGPITFVTAASIEGGTGLIAITGTPVSGTTAITLGGAVGGSITTVIAGARTLTKEDVGTWTLSGANTFTGGLTIKQGTFIAGVSNATTISGAAGPSAYAITLGSSSGGSASLLSGVTTTGYIVSNPINLGTSSAGTLTIGNSGTTAASTFNGAIGLNGNNLTIARIGTSGGLTISGAITGTGNILINNSGTSASTVLIGTATINNVGTVTNIGTSTGVTTISGIIGINVTGVIQNSSTSQLTLSGVNTFTYNGTTNLGLQIKKGIANGTTSAQAFGNGATITLGESADTTLLGGFTGTFTNPIIVASGNGIKTIRTTTATTFSGAITLNDDLVVSSSSTLATTFSGGVTGTGNILVNNISGTTATVLFTTNPLNFSGTFTNGNTITTGTTTISAAVGANVTSIIENSITSALTISGAVNTTSGIDKILQNILGAKILTVTGGITGTGNLILDNDSTLVAGITISTASPSINNLGTVTNIGSGTGTVTISGIISTNVTGVIQNSSTSQLTLAATNTFTSGVSINTGVVSASATAALGSTTSPLSLYDGATLLAAGTLTMTSARAVTFYGSATIDSSTYVVTIPKPINIPNNLTKLGTGTLTLTGATSVSVGGDLILNGGIISVPATVTIGGSLLNGGGSLTPGSSTVTFTSPDTGKYIQGNAIGTTFYNVIFDGDGGEWTIDTNPLIISNNFTMTNGILFGSTQDITVNGNVQCGITCGTIDLTGGTFTQDVAADKNFGTNVFGDSTNWNFGLLKFSNSSGSSRTITVPTIATGSIIATIGITVGDIADTASIILSAGNRLWTLSGSGGFLGDAYPTIEGRINSANTSASTSHIINFDSIPSDGDLLIVIAGFDGAPTITWPEGWARLSLSGDGTSATTQEIRYRVASSDTSNITLTTNTSVEMEARALRIGAGEYVGVPEVGTAATGNSLYPDPPAVNPSWGLDSNYFISIFTGDLALTTSVFPSNYIVAQGSANSGGTTGNTIGYAGRQLFDSSDDPSPFTKSATGPWIAQTIVVRGYPVNADVMTLNNSSIINGDTSTFKYTGDAATIACTGANYYNLELKPSDSGSSNRQSICHNYGKTLNVSNNLTIGDGFHAGATGASNNPTININGNLIVSSNATFVSTGDVLTIGNTFTKNGSFLNNDGTVQFNNSSNITIPNSVDFSNLILSGIGSKLLSGDLNISNSLTISSGTLDTSYTNNYTINADNILINGGTFNMNSSIINITGLGYSYTSGILNSGLSTIKLTDTSSSDKTFNGGSQTYNNFWLSGGDGVGSFIINGSNTFNNFKDDGTNAHSILFTSGTTQNINSWNVSGTLDNLITIDSTDTGIHNLVFTGNGTFADSDYLNIQHSIVSPIDTWYAGNNSVNNQGVLTVGSGWVFILRPVIPFDLSAYRLFNNINNANVGSPLATVNTSANLEGIGDDFRLRVLMHMGSNLPLSGQNFKLQYSSMVGSCDNLFNGENYQDVMKDTIISYQNNFYVNSGDALTPNINDPTHNGHTVVTQSYLESNNFTNSISSVLAGQDAEWGFSLSNKSTLSSAHYCLRVVKSDGSPLNNYSVIPEIITGIYRRYGGGGSISNIEDNTNPDGEVGGGGQNGGGGDTQCSDGIDNDVDTLIDINDPQCHMGGLLQNDYISTWDDETTAPVDTGGGSGTNDGGDLGFLQKTINYFFKRPSYNLLGRLLLASAFNSFNIFY